MEIRIIKVPEEKTEKLSIECHEVDAKVNAIVKFVKSLSKTFSGQLDDQRYEIAIQDIYYLESVDNRTYLYTRDKVYAIQERIYEVEEILKEASFLRISKAVVVNLLRIKSIKPALNGRFSAELFNGEEVIISRKYVQSFKDRIGGAENDSKRFFEEAAA